MIDKLQISNFRGISQLELIGLKRVNLIVGANNAGKTSLLEGLALPWDLNFEELPYLFRSKSATSRAEFGKWMINSTSSEGYVRLISRNDQASIFFDYKPLSEHINFLGTSFTIHHIENTRLARPERTLGRTAHTISPIHRENCLSISVHHKSQETLIPSFATAVRSPDKEQRLEKLLAKIDSRVRSIRLDFANNHQFISIDLGLNERVPLSQAGQGIQRLISIFSELLGHHPLVCLIDEIENGIHWTALPVIWQGIAEIAEALDIQIFATTHSRECLTTAYEVFSKRASGSEMDFSVIQLMRVKDKIEGRVLNGAHVEAAIENDIELR